MIGKLSLERGPTGSRFPEHQLELWFNKPDRRLAVKENLHIRLKTQRPGFFPFASSSTFEIIAIDKLESIHPGRLVKDSRHEIGPFLDRGVSESCKCDRTF